MSTFNCRGLGSHSKRITVLNWLKRLYNGIIYLQETHCTESHENSWRSIWKGEMFFSHGLSTARGVAILLPCDFDIVVDKVIKDKEGRFLMLVTTFNEQTLILANVYAPTKDKKEKQLNFLNYVYDSLQEYSDKNVLLGGDFNVTLNPSFDKKGGTPEKTSKCAEIIFTMMENFNLIDVWRYMNPDSRRFTRREMSKNGLVQSRLDFWLVSNHILYDFCSQDISPSIKSDHSIVHLELKIEKTQLRGRGFFKFNCSLLHDIAYVQGVKRIIENHDDTCENHGLLWDTLKSEIRGYTISYATKNKKKKVQYENELRQRCEYLERNITNENREEYATVQRELESINREYALGVQIRSRTKYMEESEQNISQLEKEENRNFKTRYIKSLYKINNIITHDPTDIMNEQKQYYSNLYKKPFFQEIDNTLFEVDAPKLSQDEKEKCDRTIEIADIAKALKELPNNKSPGTDGLTSEFYKFLGVDIKQILYESLRYAYEQKALSIEQKRGILTLIPKRDKDLRLLKTWRPLSLLNKDYKILTKFSYAYAKCIITLNQS